MSVPGTVWLVGMMGAGKSTVGPALARALGREFVDLDAEIEAAAGVRIVEIFEREGESGFRARERAAIEACAGEALVVALGGGAIAQPGAASRLRETGPVVYLRAGVETLIERLGDCAERPLLRDLSEPQRRERLGALLSERRAAYESARIAIDVDGREPAELAAAIGTALGEDAA